MGAFITVSDAAGRVLFRRPATDAEVLQAVHAAEVAEAEGQAVMQRIAEERAALDAEPEAGFGPEVAPEAGFGLEVAPAAGEVPQP